MRPFKAAAYFENIRCRVEDNDFINQDNGKLKILKKIKILLLEKIKKFDITSRKISVPGKKFWKKHGKVPTAY